MYHILNRVSDILRKKSKISQDFQGRFHGKSADFAGEKGKIQGKIGRFCRGGSQNWQKNQPISRDLSEKSQISKDFEGQVLRKIGQFHGKFLGETSPRNNQ